MIGTQRKKGRLASAALCEEVAGKGVAKVRARV
jgi:hypothetical protein